MKSKLMCGQMLRIYLKYLDAISSKLVEGGHGYVEKCPAPYTLYFAIDKRCFGSEEVRFLARLDRDRSLIINSLKNNKISEDESRCVSIMGEVRRYTVEGDRVELDIKGYTDVVNLPIKWHERWYAGTTRLWLVEKRLVDKKLFLGRHWADE